MFLYGLMAPKTRSTSSPNFKNSASATFQHRAGVRPEHERSYETLGGGQGGGEPIKGSRPGPKSMACRRFRAARVCVPT